MKPLSDFVKENKLFVVAHRGSSGTAPENTMAAYRQAIDAGAKMLEIDIQFTTDDHIIAFHDRSIAKNSKYSVDSNDMSYEYLKHIDIGTWFDKKYSDERIPLLSDVLQFTKDLAYINIEIKPQRTNDYEGKLNNLISLVKDFNAEQQVLFASFSHNLLRLIKSIDPALHTAAIKNPNDYRLPSQIAPDLKNDAYICSLNELNNAISDDINNNNLFLGIYTVDTKEQLHHALKYNVNAIGTNYPERIINELSALNEI